MSKSTVLLVFGLLLAKLSLAQPPVLDALKERYALPNGFAATVTVSLDVPGITAPDKTIEIQSKNGKGLKVKGEGLILLPKKGLIRQFNDLLNGQVHWIETGANPNYFEYKLVSLDNKSDWVTADVQINKADPRIDQVVLTTRDAGIFTLDHSYSGERYPAETEVAFETSKFSVPLKFLGKTDRESGLDSTELVTGKIVIHFDTMTIY